MRPALASLVVGLAAIAAIAGLCGCLQTPPPYACTSSAQCPGTCEPTSDGRHFCAEPDATCASGQRFGGDAGDASNVCSGVALPAGRSGDLCLVGAKFPQSYRSCVDAVCGALPTCCTSSWGPACVNEVELTCSTPCGAQLAFVANGAIAIADADSTGKVAMVAGAGHAGQAYAHVAWADLDGDATPELLVMTADGTGDSGEQSIDQYDPGASPMVSTKVDLRMTADVGGSTPLANATVYGVSVGDYDGDGRPDLATFDAYPTLLAVHDRGGLVFEIGPYTTAGPPDLVNPSGYGIGWGDVDGDGTDELAVADDKDQLVVVHVAASGDTVVWSASLPGRTYWGAWADLDGDGKLDLAVAGDSFARVYHNTGGVLDPTPVFVVDGTPFYGGTWIDVDNDGLPDLVLSINDGKLETFMNKGGTLQAAAGWVSLENHEAPTVIAADVDGDGKLDLITADHMPYTSSVYLNQGDGTFQLGTLILPAASYESVSATSLTAPTR